MNEIDFLKLCAHGVDPSEGLEDAIDEQLAKNEEELQEGARLLLERQKELVVKVSAAVNNMGAFDALKEVREDIQKKEEQVHALEKERKNLSDACDETNRHLLERHETLSRLSDTVKQMKKATAAQCSAEEKEIYEMRKKYACRGVR